MGQGGSVGNEVGMETCDIKRLGPAAFSHFCESHAAPRLVRMAVEIGIALDKRGAASYEQFEERTDKGRRDLGCAAELGALKRAARLFFYQSLCAADEVGESVELAVSAKYLDSIMKERNLAEQIKYIAELVERNSKPHEDPIKMERLRSSAPGAAVVGRGTRPNNFYYFVREISDERARVKAAEAFAIDEMIRGRTGSREAVCGGPLLSANGRTFGIPMLIAERAAAEVGDLVVVDEPTRLRVAQSRCRDFMESFVQRDLSLTMPTTGTIPELIEIELQEYLFSLQGIAVGGGAPSYYWVRTK